MYYYLNQIAYKIASKFLEAQEKDIHILVRDSKFQIAKFHGTNPCLVIYIMMKKKHGHAMTQIWFTSGRLVLTLSRLGQT